MELSLGGKLLNLKCKVVVKLAQFNWRRRCPNFHIVVLLQ